MSGSGDYISREAAIESMYKDAEAHQDHTFWTTQYEALLNIPAADVRPVPDGGIGEMSDGFHTFNGLYYQRMVLFAALVKAHKDRAWKSLRHEDGELCFGGGWFIVGIDTPQGSYTYHYEDKYWNWFECEELPVAKHWDGHTEEDVTRLMSLDVQPVVRGKWMEFSGRAFGMAEDGTMLALKLHTCSECKKNTIDAFYTNFCPNCGADMRPEPPKDDEDAEE